MEDQQPEQQALPTAPFPAPPPFWKHFTTTNIDKLRTLQEQQQATSTDTDAKDTSLPTHLSYLVPPPPPPPESTHYHTFSASHALSLLPVPPPDTVLLFDPSSPNLNLRSLLHTLTQSLLLNFLELTTILATNPSQYHSKLEDLERLFINCHYVLNMHRPRQAREEVVKMMQRQIEAGEEEIRQCESMKKRAVEFLKEVEGQAGVKRVGGGQINGNRNGVKTNHDNAETQRARRLWKAIRELDDE